MLDSRQVNFHIACRALDSFEFDPGSKRNRDVSNGRHIESIKRFDRYFSLCNKIDYPSLIDASLPSNTPTSAFEQHRIPPFSIQHSDFFPIPYFPETLGSVKSDTRSVLRKY